MEAVLSVSDIDFDPSLVTDISQLSAEEFLLYVRYEAGQCPDVVRAPVDSAKFKGSQTQYMPKVLDIPTCHDTYLPSSDWENEVIDAFSRFRLHLNKMSKDMRTRERKYVVPSMKDEASWFGFCLGGSLSEADGSKEAQATNKAKTIQAINDDVELRKNCLLASLAEADKAEEEEDEEDEEDEEEGEIQEEHKSEAVEYASRVAPSNQLLLQFDQVLTQRLLAFFASWIQLPALKIWNVQDSESVEEGEIASQYGGEHAYSWIFALLSRLEKPLYMDASATVRDLFRHLCIQRAELANKCPMSTNQASCSAGTGLSKRARESSGGAPVSNLSQLPESTQKAIAVLNTVIVVCGKYFGQGEVSHSDAAVDRVAAECEEEAEGDLHQETEPEPKSSTDDEAKRKADIQRYFAEMSAKYPTMVCDDELYQK